MKKKSRMQQKNGNAELYIATNTASSIFHIWIYHFLCNSFQHSQSASSPESWKYEQLREYPSLISLDCYLCLYHTWRFLFEENSPVIFPTRIFHMANCPWIWAILTTIDSRNFANEQKFRPIFIDRKKKEKRHSIGIFSSASKTRLLPFAFDR